MYQYSTNTTLPDSANKTSAPAGCLVLHYEGFLPWDDPRNVVSKQVEDLIRRWKDGVILPILFLIGTSFNVINMAVFHKQGLKERINVCLFALALADFFYLLQAFLLNCENVRFDRKERFGPFATFIINHNLTGFYGFTWVSEILSAIIASERCFCILYPLRSRTFFSTSTAVVVIVVVNVVIVGLYFFVVSRYRIICIYDPVSQVSSMDAVAGEFYLNHQKLIDYIDVFIYGVGLPVVMMVVVIVTTILTMIKLRQAAVWRAETSSKGGLAAKEIALSKMLVANSIFFIFCGLPDTLSRFTWLFLPEINLGTSQHNLFLVGLWLLDIVSWVNSTFNFIIYYTMGSRYRHTFWTLMGCEGEVRIPH